MSDDQDTRALTESDVEHFIARGFVKLNGAFSRREADAGLSILWTETGCDPSDRATWTKPLVRLGNYGQDPFRRAANTPILHAAFDRLVGRDRWIPRTSLGTFPIRFPSQDDPGDTGWHVDASFGTDVADYTLWRVNVRSTGRALLMLFLFSDVGPDDAPTRIRAGSHLDVARLLAPAGDDGMTFRELAAHDFLETVGRPEVLATGEAGTVYLCHPFLVHAAQRHNGTRPRFVAQPPLYAVEPFSLRRDDQCYVPVERAIRRALLG